jgi:hypothetical protein
METCTVNNVSSAEAWDCVSLVRPEGGTVDLTVPKGSKVSGTIKLGDEVKVNIDGNRVEYLSHQTPAPPVVKATEPPAEPIAPATPPASASPSQGSK